jgi:2-polyprenyl-3-methyl-5-hydroxy-6-metoxy-1,4-benzoquinol methylase
MDRDKVKQFADRAFADMAGAMTAGMAYLGVKTGLFRAMAGKGPMIAAEVASASKLQPRYVEEWLKGMASAGYLEYDRAAQSFRLPDEHAFLLASDGTDHFAGGLFLFAPVLLRVAPQVAEAFETGGGVPFKEYGVDGVTALDAINRGNYEHRLAGYWLKSLPQVVAALEAGGRALDVGCGAGRICIALAKAFPNAEITGLDPDAESIRHAKAAAQAEGVGSRIRFLAQSTGTAERGTGFDLITAFDCVHDFATPHRTLAEIGALLKPDGTLFIAEPKAADRLEDNFHPIGTMFYGFSLFHCMTQSLANGGPGLGTCMGPARLKALLQEAGFSRFETLDIKSQVNSFYAARQ